MRNRGIANRECSRKEARSRYNMRLRACQHLLAVLDVVHELLSTLLALCFDQDQGLVSLLYVQHRRGHETHGVAPSLPHSQLSHWRGAQRVHVLWDERGGGAGQGDMGFGGGGRQGGIQLGGCMQTGV